ncbi:unnamed protein product [Arctia plantaginis]|uniref:Arrestin C-terminal-like domain-containing protein n=1 Tax=Arctia plantaginis TaxID=874455 RepID=A0A8S1ADF9_ARCPL|nr:unnamed protein product [Arctia plantaginis]
MGISCEIHLFKPVNGVYYSGQNVSGVIKYSVDEPMTVDKIVTSLKGIGYIAITADHGSTWERTYKTTTSYIDVDTVIIGEKKQISVGSYEIKFRYTLPGNIPSTMKARKAFKFKSYKVKCFIKYYIRIKFERPGVFAFNKHFRKEVDVLSKTVPTLPREPAVYTENKKLLRLFTKQDSIITINATILNSVIPMEGKIELRYEVQNNSHVVIKTTTTQLVQGYLFKSKGHRKVIYGEAVPDTEAQTLPINCQETQNRTISIDVPSGLYNVENTMIVARFYRVRITAQLPIPYKNVILDVPVQIGIFEENLNVNRTEVTNEDINSDNLPPSYWEVMGEANEEYGVDSDDETDTTKLFKRRPHSDEESAVS